MAFLGVVLLVSLIVNAVAVNEGKSSSSTSPNHATPSDTVSWQSAYWALVALSLNAMTQNSALDRDFPSAILFPMRSYPLVCAADAIEVVLRLLWYMYSARLSAPYAAQRVVQETMWRGPRGPTITLANQYPLSHTVLFVLGVLPQAVKLFGMPGMPWTHVWGGLYLSSYLILAGVGALARRAGPTTNVPLAAFREKEVRLLKFGVVVAQVGLWLWCMWRILGLAWSSTPREFTLRLIQFATYVDIFLLLVIVAVRSLLVLMADPMRPNAAAIVTILVSYPFAMGFYILMSMFIPYLESHHMDSGMTFWLLVLVVVFWVGVLVLLRYVNFPANFRAIFKVSFGVGNLVFSILYYRFLYEPRGTVKPPWTEKLG